MSEVFGYWAHFAIVVVSASAMIWWSRRAIQKVKPGLVRAPEVADKKITTIMLVGAGIGVGVGISLEILMSLFVLVTISVQKS